MPSDDLRRQLVEVFVRDEGTSTRQEIREGVRRSTARLKARADALQKKQS